MTIKRHYDNSKREAKAEATRQKIIDALIQQLIENNTPDFSVEEAAATAGNAARLHGMQDAALGLGAAHRGAALKTATEVAAVVRRSAITEPAGC